MALSHRSTIAAFALAALAGASAVFAQQRVVLVSKMGSMCLDAEAARSTDGTRIIAYACNGGANQTFVLNSNGTITQNGKCLDVKGGLGNDGDEIVLWSCNGGANQRWTYSGGHLVGMKGKCMDLKGAEGFWVNRLVGQNQPAILWPCNGQNNQTFYKGALVPQTKVSGATLVQSGQLASLKPTTASGVIAPGGGNIVASGAGNIVASGAGNVIAAGGGNVIAIDPIH